MNPPEIVKLLNRLLQVLGGSLPMYLSDAHPWTCRDQQPMQGALANLVADQRAMMGRIAAMILQHGGQPRPARFPINFTSANDLSLDFLLEELIEHQRFDVAAIERCVAGLAEAPPAQSLAEEVLGNARGHLEILEETASRS